MSDLLGEVVRATAGAADTGELQAAARALGDVAELRAEIEQQLILLTVGLAERRIRVDVRKDMAVREEEIEPAIEISWLPHKRRKSRWRSATTADALGAAVTARAYPPGSRPFKPGARLRSIGLAQPVVVE